MASQGGGQRVVHQDYIVRQRYSNALPPPPGAPKLLEIPQQGLNQYTMPHYASRMAREQPMNIEADAFLGMDINLVGMPGVFDGDESSIQAPLVPPPVHPKDRSLLRPLKSLGKPKSEVADVSFLRRNQYTAEDRTRIEQGARAPTGNVKRRNQDRSKEDPMNILRSVIKGFDIANSETAYKGPDSGDNIRGLPATSAELDAWKSPKHPTNPQLKLIDTYPLLPDLEVATDEHGFSIFKFTGNPSDATDGPDPRMRNALLHPLEPSPRVTAEYQVKVAAHKADPEKNPDPGLPPLSYEFFLPSDTTTAHNMVQRFDVDNPGRDDAELYTFASEGGENDSFRYSHVRVYDPGHQVDLRTNPYQEVAVAIYDSELDRKRAKKEGAESPLKSDRQKAAYYYPIMSKVQLKPRRAVNLQQMGMAAKVEDEEEKIDNLDVHVGEEDDDERERRTGFKSALEVAEHPRETTNMTDL